jgi:hypothetical protein
MKVAFIVALFLTTLASSVAGESRIKSPEISSDNSPEAVARAKQQGTETALADIKVGHPVILYIGLPWSVGKPLVDDATGLPVEIVAGCTVTGVFSAEVNAYNDAVRAWHAKKQAYFHAQMTTTATPNHAMQLTGSARHGLCYRPADLPAQAAPRSACS